MMSQGLSLFRETIYHEVKTSEHDIELIILIAEDAYHAGETGPCFQFLVESELLICICNFVCIILVTLCSLLCMSVFLVFFPGFHSFDYLGSLDYSFNLIWFERYINFALLNIPVLYFTLQICFSQQFKKWWGLGETLSTFSHCM